MITEAAAVGTPTVAYNVAGLRDSVQASSGVLTAPSPKQLSSVLEEFLSTWMRDGLPDISPGGVVPWGEVAATILAIAMSATATTTKSLPGSDIWKKQVDK